jgi:ATP-dependent DNA helicase RecQ
MVRGSMSDSGKQSSEAGGFASRCLSIDLEVGVRDARIHAFAAVRGDTGQVFIYRKGDLAESLARLDNFAEGTDFLLGHNQIDFDAVHLAAVNPSLRLLKLPMVDTIPYVSIHWRFRAIPTTTWLSTIRTAN